MTPRVIYSIPGKFHPSEGIQLKLKNTTKVRKYANKNHKKIKLSVLLK